MRGHPCALVHMRVWSPRLNLELAPIPLAPVQGGRGTLIWLAFLAMVLVRWSSYGVGLCFFMPTPPRWRWCKGVDGT